jgi:hypothetical protein
VADPLARVAQQRSRQPLVLGPRREVALEDGIHRRGHHRGLQQVLVAVAEAVDADPADEVDLHGAVGEAHTRAATGPGEQQGEEQRPAPDPLEPADLLPVGLGLEGPCGALGRHGGEQRLRRLLDGGRLRERVQR